MVEVLVLGPRRMTFLMLWRANTWGGEKRTEKDTKIKNAILKIN